jgi:hypothetical protein
MVICDSGFIDANGLLIGPKMSITVPTSFDFVVNSRVPRRIACFTRAMICPCAEKCKTAPILSSKSTPGKAKIWLG